MCNCTYAVWQTEKYTGLLTITIRVTNIKLKIMKNDLIKQNKNNKN